MFWRLFDERRAIKRERDELHAEVERLRAENRGLRETITEWQEIHGTFTGDIHAACQAEIERLRAAVRELLTAGEHEGECTNSGSWGDDACELHVEASNRREQMACQAL